MNFHLTEAVESAENWDPIQRYKELLILGQSSENAREMTLIERELASRRKTERPSNSGGEQSDR
jgi:hypothetical protein